MGSPYVRGDIFMPRAREAIRGPGACPSGV